jgi:hypothetical protein
MNSSAARHKKKFIPSLSEISQSRGLAYRKILKSDADLSCKLSGGRGFTPTIVADDQANGHVNLPREQWHTYC